MVLMNMNSIELTIYTQLLYVRKKLYILIINPNPLTISSSIVLHIVLTSLCLLEACLLLIIQFYNWILTSILNNHIDL